MRETAHEHCVLLASDPLCTRKARRWLTRLVLAAGFTPQDTHDLAVAFSEAAANVHRHAYRGRRDGRVEVRVAVDGMQIAVTLKHDGVPFDPEAYRPPDLGRPSESGYGLYLLASLVDRVSFEGERAGGRVVLVKRRSTVGLRD